MREMVATALIVAAVLGWVAATVTRANAVKFDLPPRYSTGGALPTQPIAKGGWLSTQPIVY